MNALTIQPGIAPPAAQNYNLLRLEAIKAIEHLSGVVWTDYNDSDPGITIMEALCYALTDLAYRVSLPMEDLLSKADPHASYWLNNFYTARQILPSSPVTFLDLRKMAIDSDGVLNAWVEPSLESEVLLFLDSSTGALTYKPENNKYLCLHGLYKVYVEFEDAVIREKRQSAVIRLIQEKLSHHRNLGEDLVEVSAVQYAEFTVKVSLTLHEGADLNQVEAKIFLAIKNFFSPQVNFYSLEEMLAKGYTHDEIFEGPLLRHGFIDEAELAASSELKISHLSDLVKVLLEIDELIAITDFDIPETHPNLLADTYPDNDFSEWMESQGKDRKIPRLDTANSQLVYSRAGDRFRPQTATKAEPEQVQSILNFLEGAQAHSRLHGYHPDLVPPRGLFMDTGNFFPVQRTLPHCYNQHYSLITEQIKDLNKRFSLLKQLDSSKILPLQLKGYMMIFEQLLANHFAQLAHLGDLYSFSPTVKSTYFSQLPSQVFDVDYLLNTSIERFGEHDLPGMVEKRAVFGERRERFLDQVAAMFGEDMSNYNALMHQLDGDRAAAKIVSDQGAFLGDYVELSNYRSRGMDYKDKNAGWGSSNISGFEKRLSRLLGFTDYRIRQLAVSFIKIHPIERENGIERFVVKVVDPDQPDMVLLTSPEYETQAEAENTLNYLLKNGWNKAVYQDGFTQTKVSYNLMRPTDEGDREVVAFKHLSLHSGNSKEVDAKLKTDFNRLLELMNQIAANEGIHIVEHILLRPKLGPRHGGKKAHLDTDLVDLMVKGFDRALAPVPPTGLHDFQIQFHPKNSAGIWRLSLQDPDGKEVLTVAEEFEFYRHVVRRVDLIRQYGSDSMNYQKVLLKDGSFQLELRSLTHILATGLALGTEIELDAQTETLVKYFALEASVAATNFLVNLVDPYSYQISVIIPDWPKRFQNASFQHLMEQTIYLESPAHLHVNVYWLGHGAMMDFEEAYRLWLDELAAGPMPNAEIVNNLISELNSMKVADADPGPTGLKS